MPVKIEFGRRQVANGIRNRLEDFLAESDDRRTLTVTLQDRVPESMIQRVREEAADSRQAEAAKAGQASLTDAERSRIDFSRPGVNVPKARSIKGIAKAEGVTDWIQFADFELTVDENRAIMERASREERGRSGMGRSQERDQLQRAGQAKQQRRQQAEQAKGAAFRGDSEAIGFLEEEQRFEDDLFDISLRGGPSGSDFEELEAAHQERPERAQTLDEMQTASVTRDPLQWAAAPDVYDFPGIDTVDPAGLHAERSEEARQRDEVSRAPIADSRQQWAFAPDEYDWPGVDTPTGPAVEDIAEDAADMQFAAVDVLSENVDDVVEETAITQTAERFDVSLDPREARGDVGTDSQLDTGRARGSNLADVPEADRAFAAAEEERSGESESFVDDRAEQGSMVDFGMETDGTVFRESREAVESATEFGVDDRGDVGGGGEPDSEQEGFEVFGGGTRENETLF